MRIRVWILCITHKHGTDVSVVATKEEVDNLLTEYARQWWDHEFNDRPMPEDPDQVVTDYFENVEGEWIDIRSEYLEMPDAQKS